MRESWLARGRLCRWWGLEMGQPSLCANRNRGTYPNPKPETPRAPHGAAYKKLWSGCVGRRPGPQDENTVQESLCIALSCQQQSWGVGSRPGPSPHPA